MRKICQTAPALFAIGLSMTACSGGNIAPPVGNPAPNAAAGSSAPQTLSDLLDGPAAAGPRVTRIYVAEYSGNGGPGSVGSFKPSGKPSYSTSAFMSNPQDIVFDAKDDLYVTGFGGSDILKFDKNLKYVSTPIPTVSDYPVGLAVGPTGNIYVTLYHDHTNPTGTLVTFNKNGKPIGPTILGSGSVSYVAVDSAGKIYVTNSGTNTLNTYDSNGNPTTPTITAGLNGPGPVRVDAAGKIYVANGGNNTITTYKPNGTQTSPTIAVTAPHGLAVAENGNIYVTDSLNMTALAFDAQGTQIKPAITGLAEPTGIAVLNSH
jgi:streptogramin lyase